MDLVSGSPLWVFRSGILYDYPKLEADENTDVVIMGGGISGALVSYYLTEEGVPNIVVDQRTIGLGSTCASTALLQYELDTPLSELQFKVGKKNAVAAYQLCDRSIYSLKKIAEKIKFADFERCGSLYYAAFKKDRNFIKEEYEIRKQNGFDVKLLSNSDIKDEFSIDVPCGIFSAQGAQTDAYSFTHALHRHSINKGSKVYDRTQITQIIHGRNGVKLTTATGAVIRAKKLVYATGYETGKYIDKKIVDLHSTYAVCSEQGNVAAAPFANKAMLWNTADPYLYLRTTADNRILIGGRDEKFSNPAKRDLILKKKALALVKDFERLYPKVPFLPEFSWCGTFGATKDGLPYIGTYDKLSNGYFALGFGGNGITFSLIAAEILKDLITGKKNNDVSIFSFNR